MHALPGRGLGPLVPTVVVLVFGESFADVSWICQNFRKCFGDYFFENGTPVISMISGIMGYAY